MISNEHAASEATGTFATLPNVAALSPRERREAQDVPIEAALVALRDLRAER